MAAVPASPASCSRVSAVARVALVAVGWSAWGPHALAGPVTWRSGAAELRVRPPIEIEALLLARAADPGVPRRVVVRFSQPVDRAARAGLAANGMRLLQYLGDNAFFASLEADRLNAAALSRAFGLIAVEDIRTEWKLHPLLAAGPSSPGLTVRGASDGTPIVAAYVVFHRDVDLNTEALDLAATHRAEVRGLVRSINTLVVELPQDQILLLGTQDAVQWIEPPLPALEPVNNSNRARTGADVLQTPPYNLSGDGVTVMVFDSGVGRATHVDFEGRLIARDSATTSNHATHVAGTIGGAGIANSLYKGMAPAVSLLSYGLQQEGGLHLGFLYTDPCDIEQDYSDAIAAGADIANNSIGTNTAANGFPCEWEGDYGVTSALIDTIVRGDGSHPLFTTPFRIIWANGNERGGAGRCGKEFHTTAPPACAKNHIAVGALQSNDDSMTDFSSWGPADDDRLRPDFCAPGCQADDDYGVTSCSAAGDTSYTSLCGTSMASPTVCGLCALLLEDFRAHYPGQPDPRNSTLKALLAQTAVDLGNPGPDYRFGYGSVRIQPAIELMRAGSFLEAQVNQGDTYSFIASVNPGEQLKITLAWDDVPAAPNVVRTLVNDLDLRVYNLSNARFYPWTLGGLTDPNAPALQTREDHVNNIEQVLVDNPLPGTWLIQVYGYNVPENPQPFSLAVAPRLAGCSSEGIIALLQPSYGCSALARIEVIDCDLNTSPGQLDTVTVTVASDSEPGGETVLLTETDPNSAAFRGDIQLSLTNAPGVLQVAPGDLLTATYVDADNGHGGLNVPVSASAPVDCLGPVIAGVQASAVTPVSAVVSFTTDEMSFGTVRYGQACTLLTGIAAEWYPGIAHQIALANLAPGTPYYFAVDALDLQGNLATDDNNGQCYTFATPGLVHSFPLDADPGWTTEGDWAFGQPTGAGSYACRDPGAGYTGNNVYGNNLEGLYQQNQPVCYLTTTPLNCAGHTNLELHFWRWLGVVANDPATVEVSSDGQNWTTVWSTLEQTCDQGLWKHMAYDISAVADNQPTVYIRWGLGPTHQAKFPGWNIDDIEIWSLPQTLHPGDLNCDDAVDFNDINPFVLALSDPLAYQAAFPNCNILNGDCNGDGAVNFADINPFVALLTGAPGRE